MATAPCSVRRSPTGMPRLAVSSAILSSGMVTPLSAICSGLTSIRIARFGPPIVVTSRVPFTRFKSISI